MVRSRRCGGGRRDHRGAAIRETAEETGLEIGHPGPAILTRRFRWVFEGTAYDQEETYFLVRTSGVTVADTGWTGVERATLVGHRWWTIDELRTTSEVVYPEGLAALLDRVLRSWAQFRRLTP